MVTGYNLLHAGVNAEEISGAIVIFHAAARVLVVALENIK